MKFTNITDKNVLSLLKQSISLPQLHIDGPYSHVKYKNKKYTPDEE